MGAVEGLLDLNDVVGLVVWPTIAGMLRPDELDFLRISIDRFPAFRVEVNFSFGADDFRDVVYDDAWGAVDVNDLRERLASDISDFIAESRLGWGQERQLGMPGAIASDEIRADARNVVERRDGTDGDS